MLCYFSVMNVFTEPGGLKQYSAAQIAIVNNSASMAEEMVSNHYKMSASEWLRPKYDVKTLADLRPEEIVHGPFAQIIRYEGQRKDKLLGSSAYDFYKICLQDHNILSVINTSRRIELLPFTLYIITHELIHIVRFSKFLQQFDASFEEKMLEETRVHEKTHEILGDVRLKGLDEVLRFYNKWC
ncbi:hypothetical protein ACFLZM_06180, partial [Thermodesulfobacteriota bacterium]